jgi:hypothetical protein
MRRLAVVTVACVVTFFPAGAAAQRLAAEFPISHEPAPAQKPERVKVGDYRYVGMVTLGLVGTIVGLAVGAKASCDTGPSLHVGGESVADTRTCGDMFPIFIFTGLVGGAGLGYILGRNTPKWAPATP